MSGPPPTSSSSSPSSQTGLPTEYTNLLNELNRTIHRERPRDIIQFCANWFNKRLEDQRIDFIQHSSYDPRNPQSPLCMYIDVNGRLLFSTDKHPSGTNRDNLRRTLCTDFATLRRSTTRILLLSKQSSPHRHLLFSPSPISLLKPLL